MVKFKKWMNNLSGENKDQVDVLIEEFNIWLYNNNKKFVNAIKAEREIVPQRAKNSASRSHQKNILIK